MAQQQTEMGRYLTPLKNAGVWVLPGVLSLLLVIISRYDFLAFHTLAELSSIVVAFSIFTFGWYARAFTKHSLLIILSCGYLWIGSLDLVHTLAYKGMNLFVHDDGNTATQFWIVARYAEAVLLLLTPFFIHRPVHRRVLLSLFGGGAVLLMAAILNGYFPTAFVKETGLTPFKVVSEYIIITLLILAIGSLLRIRKLLTADEVSLILLSIVFSIVAEFTFTLYVSVYGLSNLVGHIFKLFSYWFIFHAVVSVGLKKTYSELLESNEQLALSHVKLKKLSMAIDQSPVSIIITDVAGNIEFANPFFLDVTGYRLDEVIGSNPRILQSGETSRFEYERMWQQLLAGNVWRGEFHNRRKDGTLYWESATISPIKSEDGTITSYLGIKQNITRRKELEAEMFSQKEMLETFFNSIPDAIFMVDKGRRIVSINPGVTRIFGYTLEDLVGRETAYFYESREEFERQGRIRFNLTAAEQLEPYVVNYRRKDGSIFPGESIGRKLVDHAGAITGYMGVIRDITERVEHEVMLRRHEVELKHERDIAQRYLDISPVMFCALDENGLVTLINQQGCELLGYSEDELLHRNWFELVVPPEIRAEIKSVFTQIMCSDVHLVEYYENNLITKSGEKRLFSFHNTAIRGEQGQHGGILCSADDITDRVQAEKVLRHAHKMEAVGQLTGGIAHDFNNILGVVVGNLELLQMQVGQVVGTENTNKALKRIDAALTGAQRGAAITRKLLDFSRGESLDSKLTDINPVIAGMKELIAKSLTPHINIDTRLAEALWKVKVDVGEFEDVLLNLAINARDAMPDGGVLVIETGNKVIDEGYAMHNPESRAGEFVELTVSDDGCGMSEAVRERIFEPFFSTKEVGKGTGLGMSMVFGFVRRAKGFIHIYSEEGQGTSIRLYLPRVTQQDGSAVEQHSQDNSNEPTGNEIILVVDDEAMLREMSVEILEDLGYTTFAANNGDEALEIIRQHPEIDLLFTDVIMPGEHDGHQLAVAAIEMRPQLKVLLASGFLRKQNTFVNGKRKLADQLNRDMLHKPYGRFELASAVRRALDMDER